MMIDHRWRSRPLGETLMDWSPLLNPLPEEPSLSDPCPHPARKGNHEIYTTKLTTHCRACGAKDSSKPMSERQRPKYLTSSSKVEPGVMISFGDWLKLRGDVVPESYRDCHPKDEMQSRIIWDHALEVYQSVGEKELREAVVASAKHWHKVTSDPNATMRAVVEAETGLRGTVKALLEREGKESEAPVLLTIRRPQIKSEPGRVGE